MILIGWRSDVVNLRMERGEARIQVKSVESDVDSSANGPKIPYRNQNRHESRGNRVVQLSMLSGALLRVVGLVLLTFLLTPADCAAQGLFGQRTLGGSIGNRSERQAGRASGASGAGQSAAASQAAVPQRFRREERQSGEFVGRSTAADAAADFVGREGTAQAVVGAAVGLTEVRPPVNRPRVLRGTGLYPERLTLATELSRVSGEDRIRQSRAVSRSVTDYLQTAGMFVEVSPEARLATVRGAVRSVEERRKVELLLLMEPGIESVQNQLTIDPNAPLPVHRQRAAPGDR
jgi:hypothetical protein